MTCATQWVRQASTLQTTVRLRRNLVNSQGTGTLRTNMGPAYNGTRCTRREFASLRVESAPMNYRDIFTAHVLVFV